VSERADAQYDRQAGLLAKFDKRAQVLSARPIESAFAHLMQNPEHIR
jgi:hypothetical protein